MNSFGGRNAGEKIIINQFVIYFDNDLNEIYFYVLFTIIFLSTKFNSNTLATIRDISEYQFYFTCSFGFAIFLSAKLRAKYIIFRIIQYWISSRQQFSIDKKILALNHTDTVKGADIC